MTNPHVVYLAHHWLLLAGPAFLPAVVVVAVILYIAVKDRRTSDDGEQASAAGKAEDRQD